MTAAALTTLVDALRQYRLLEPAQLQEVAREALFRFPEPNALAEELIRRGWLTAYQANHLLQGRGQELLLGSYVLLEKLGEGGMGQVFKARNWKLGRIVALKLIRKERLESPDAVRRFQREIQAAAALSHPNIVPAHDADHIDGAHLLVMEYVEGATDLARLVNKNGPLPVAEACEYIRQAALGLQHAHERGLVHRDVKPANLLLTADRKMVKLLDLGLARLDQPATDAETSTAMTEEGTVMGTPDYIAPEQALESHSVDIRADLYSLGCSFYFLLTGKPPFPGGTLLQKLDKHRYAEPIPIEALRPEVARGVARVVRKLMAKKPEDRYQTPADVATVLASPLGPGNDPDDAEERTLCEGRQTRLAETSDAALASPFASLVTDPVEGAAASRLRQPVDEGRWLLYLVAGASLLLVSVVLIVSHFWKEPVRTGPLVKEEDPPIRPRPPPGPKSDDAWRKEIAGLPVEQQREAVAVWLKERNPGFDGKLKPEIGGAAGTRLAFLSDHVTDLTPVQALKELRTLLCSGSAPRQGKLADLSPLKDMKLTYLDCRDTQVHDLAPLENMNLTYLNFWRTKVSDLSPLKNRMLTSLHFSGTNVSDLSPLKNMKLKRLNCRATKVTDLSPLENMMLTDLNCSALQISSLAPLKNMKLTYLHCYQTKVNDLSPLKGMPLEDLHCDFKPERDAAILRSIKTLKTINGRPAKEFWQEVDVQKP